MNKYIIDIKICTSPSSKTTYQDEWGIIMP